MQSFTMIFSGGTIIQRVEFPIFSIDFCMGLTTVTVQRYFASCDRCNRQFAVLKIYQNALSWISLPVGGGAYSALPDFLTKYGNEQYTFYDFIIF